MGWQSRRADDACMNLHLNICCCYILLYMTPWLLFVAPTKKTNQQEAARVLDSTCNCNPLLVQPPRSTRMQSPVQVVSRRTVKPPPRPRERIPLTTWDLSFALRRLHPEGAALRAAALLLHLHPPRRPPPDHPRRRDRHLLPRRRPPRHRPAP
jgi:hypothetical protein